MLGIVDVDENDNKVITPVTGDVGNSLVEQAKAYTDAKNSYSTTEQLTGGKWIDGRPIYRKTVNTGALPSSAGDKQINHNISNLDFVIHIEGFALNPLTRANLLLPSVSNNKTYDLGLWNDNTVIDISVGINRSSYSISYVTLFYVKTTD